MSTNWKPGDRAHFKPANLSGGQNGFDLGGILVPIADLDDEIEVQVDGVKGDDADISTVGGASTGAKGKAKTKDLILIA